MVVMMLVLVMLMMMSTATFSVMVVMMLVLMFMMVFYSFFKQFIFKISLLFHSSQYLFTIDIIPRCSYYCCFLIVLTKHCNTFFKLLICKLLASAYYNSLCMFNLVIVKFTKILHIHLSLKPVYYCCKTIYNHFI